MGSGADRRVHQDDDGLSVLLIFGG
jgi:hypothetical protein